MGRPLDARHDELVDQVVPTAADVTHVVVAGRPVMEQRRPLRLGDVGQIRATILLPVVHVYVDRRTRDIHIAEAWFLVSACRERAETQQITARPSRPAGTNVAAVEYRGAQFPGSELRESGVEWCLFSGLEPLL
jgi:hypothetical protein